MKFDRIRTFYPRDIKIYTFKQENEIHFPLACCLIQFELKQMYTVTNLQSAFGQTPRSVCVEELRMLVSFSMDKLSNDRHNGRVWNISRKCTDIRGKMISLRSGTASNCKMNTMTASASASATHRNHLIHFGNARTNQ